MTKPSSDSQLKSFPVDFDPFAGGDLLLTAPATASQQEIWTSVKMGDEANCAYNESQSLRLRGQLDVKALQESLQALVQRHESLRTTLSSDGNNLCIVANGKIKIPFIDLSSFSEQERETYLAKLKREAVEQPFNLEHGPLFRAESVKLQPQEHLIILTAHHIICDGWSWGVLIPDLAKLYSAFCQGNAPDLAKPECFSDYALSQAEEAGSPNAIATESFWLNQFSKSIPLLDFPTDRPRPPVRTFDSAREDWELSSKLVTELKQLGKTNGCSFMTTLLAAFEVWLYRLTGQQDLIVGIPAAGQADSGQYNLVGHCVNLLPLRSQIDPEQGFNDYLRSRRSTLLDAYDHQQFTFGNLLSKLAIPRDSSRIPLVPIIFNLDQGLEGDKLPFAGLEVEFFSNPRTYENFELYVNATELKSKIVLECQYNTNLFDAKTIRSRLEELEVLLVGIVTNPDQTIATLPILTATERQCLAQWNQTQVPYPQDQSIHQLFEAQVEKTPDAVAVVFEEVKITYRELNKRANQLAHYLQKLGVRSEVLVGICLERSIEMIVGLLGILKAGGAYVPLDPSYPSERLAFMLNDAQVSVLLTREKLLTILPEHQACVVCLDRDWENIAQEPSDNCANLSSPFNLIYILYTSGSTGKPKGVAIEHHSAVALIDWAQQIFTGEQLAGVLASTSICFDLSVFELFLPLSRGGKIILARDALHLPTLLAAQDVRLINTVPSAIAELLKINGIPQSVHTITLAGEPLRYQLVQDLYQLGSVQSVFNLYGPSEDTTYSTFALTEKEASKSPPIGRPISNTQIYILDHYLQPLPIGVSGELHIGGAGLARGYLNSPDLTSEKFIPNPFSDDPESRLYKTGDIARYLPDGNIEYLGRIDHQVKWRGFRIELGEIEAVLSQHPSVRETTVILREDIPGDKRLVAYVVSPGGQTTTTSDLRSFLKHKLPDYMVPSVFVLLERLPLTPNGKVDRKALPIPDATRPDLVATYMASRTPLEQQIAEIWLQVLRLERVGIQDNFFELGGHSLLGAQIMARISKAFQVKLPLRTLFEVPTVAELAQRIETILWAAQTIQTPELDTSDDYETGEL